MSTKIFSEPLYLKCLAEAPEVQQTPYAVHWGKINRILDKGRLFYMIGEERIKNGKRQR